MASLALFKVNLYVVGVLLMILFWLRRLFISCTKVTAITVLQS